MNSDICITAEFLMARRKRDRERTAARMKWSLSALLALSFAAVAGVPNDPIEAHRFADGVLAPRFHAAMNDFSYQHPSDRQGQPWSHVHTSNPEDRERWANVRATFRDLDAAMKRAGY